MSPTSVHDRLLAVYRREMPDHIPIGAYQRYAPRGLAERQAREIGLGTIAYVPVVSMPGPPWHLYPGYLSEIRGANLRINHRWDSATTTAHRDIRHWPSGRVATANRSVAIRNRKAATEVTHRCDYHLGC